MLAPREPTSCFTLPTPAASMDMIAIAVVPTGNYDLSNPVVFGFGDNGTTPRYVSALAQGDPYVLDLSPGASTVGQLGLQIPGEEALLFDGSGLHLYSGNCSSLTEVLVDDFYGQLSSIAGRSSRRDTMLTIPKRQSLNPSTFAVAVAIDAYLKKASFEPNLTFGGTQCTHELDTNGAQLLNITWSCLYPPPAGGASVCASNLNTWLSDMNSHSAHPRNASEVLAIVGPFLDLSGDSILNLFPDADPALGLGFTFMRQVESAARKAVGAVGGSACEVLHVLDSDDLILADGGPLGTKTVGSYMTAPPPAVAVNLAASATSIITGIPRRKVNPTDNFLKQIATDFESIFYQFTHWLGGLPHLTLGFEETGTSPARLVSTHHVATLESLPKTAVPSIAHSQLATVTVTHVLGDGWVDPSTYIVAPDTSSLVPVPASKIDATGDSSAYQPTWISLQEYVDSTSSTSSPTYASASIVNHVLAQLAAMDMGDASVQPGHRWDLPSNQAHGVGVTTTGISLGHEGHVVVVTTTIYLAQAREGF